MPKSLPAICLWLFSSTALAATQVTAVTASGGQVSISASAPPNFTTFTMSGPPRLVIDVADATFKGVPADISVNANDIVAIKTMNYSSGTARVIVTYTKEIDTDILTSGNDIVVRPSSSLPSMQEVPAGAPAPEIAGGGAAIAPPSSPTSEPVPPAADSPVAPAPPNKEEIAAEAPPTEKVAEPSHTTAYAQTEATPPPPAAQTVPPDANWTAKETAPAPAPTPTAAPAPAAAPAAQQPPEVASAAEPAPAPAAATPAKSRSDEAASPTPPAASSDIEISKRKKKLQLVGLRFNGSPSVFIRTNEPARYSVKDEGTHLKVIVENTRITRRNDSRPLDVHFFDSPIATVHAHQIGRNVQVDIDLKNQAPYQATQAGQEVQLTFNK